MQMNGIYASSTSSTVAVKNNQSATRSLASAGNKASDAVETYTPSVIDEGQQELRALGGRWIGGREFASVHGTDYSKNFQDDVSGFLVKSAYERDQLLQRYTGDELNQRLEQYDKQVQLKIEDIAQTTASTLSQYLNVENDSPIFDKDQLASRIKGMLQEQQQILGKLQSEQGDKWNQVIEQGGKGITDFRDQLKQATSQAFATESTSFQDISYQDVAGVFNALVHTTSNALNTYSNNTEWEANMLGTARLKLDLYLQQSPMSSAIKEQFTQSVDTAMNNKLRTSEFNDYKTSLMINPKFREKFQSREEMSLEIKRMFDKQLQDPTAKKSEGTIMWESMKGLLNQKPEDIRSGLMNAFNSLHHSFISAPSMQGDVGPQAKLEFANQVRDESVEDWNSFISSLNMDQQQKSALTIPKNSIDIKV
ncbi:hypothetical protein [Paenibacillus massiliensis]|uniref:hypothetical protein n=1 Tax=Paenibacillus massiliensis TaxID=225917 RepID=UPI00035FC8BC|nr:hypothetical protein [Paenibacillus massiliensis]